MTRSSVARTRRRWAVLAIAALVIVWIVGVGLWSAGRGTPEGVGQPRGVEAPQGHLPSPSGGAPTPAEDAPVVQEQLAELRAMPAIQPDPRLRGRISAEARTQPDLYAAEFVRMLLTQDYGRPREEHLAWVATEAGTTAEPLIVGLVPPQLRDRLAVYSVVAQGDGAASSPIPSAADWARLGTLGAYTTVSDIRVSEPLAWSNAVEAGRVTDAGVTAREITATVILHTTAGTNASRSSVSLTADFVGPPTYPTWRFVNVVLYTSLPEGRS